MNNKFLRKAGVLLMALAVTASMTCCNSGDTDNSGEAPAEIVSGSSADTTTLPPVTHDEMRDIPSMELVKEIKVGWSLGNTLDANGVDGVSGLDTETSWGNPKATYELFTAVKDAGFNIVRIPVTWTDHMDSEGNIDEEWMDRVQEVVDYAYGQDLFVILNIHHENWHDPYYDNEAAASELLRKVWTQIGTRFQDYDEKLIFEGLNEPRKRNTPQEWNGGDAEGHEVVNHLDAVFVETIRSLGGNNPKRHLMIPTYAASVTDSAMNDFVFPEGDDKLILSLHAYTPYDFALNLDLTKNEFSEDKGGGDIKWLMNSIKTKFLDNNIPVILGEFGAVSKGNMAERVEWVKFYISEAKKIGVPCLWFDNGAFSGDGENLGLMDRNVYIWRFKDVADAMIEAAYAEDASE